MVTGVLEIYFWIIWYFLGINLHIIAAFWKSADSTYPSEDVTLYGINGYTYMKSKYWIFEKQIRIGKYPIAGFLKNF